MNMGKPAIWILCLIGSLGVHTGLLAVLGLVVKPEAAKDQPIPKSRMRIQTQNVKRDDARQATANAETLSQQHPESAALGQGIVPQSRAEATPTDGEPLDPIRPLTDLVHDSDGDVQRVSIAPQETEIQTAMEPAFVVIPQTTATSNSLTRIVVTQQIALKLDLTAGPIELSAPSDRAASAVQLDLPAQASTAALAWSGSGSVTVDPSSLAAIQAFMQPNELSYAGGIASQVRDGVAAVLAAVPCARLQTTFIPETGQLELRGHIPEDSLRGPILKALKQRVGNAIPVTDKLLILPHPQCATLVGISNVGLPQSTEQLTNPRVIGETGFARKYLYYAGQRLSLELLAPDYDGYVYVDYFTSDGTVIHLQPNQIVPQEIAKAKSQLTVGIKRKDKPSLNITISAPFGQEIAAAFASSVPLYDNVRPIQEPAHLYLDFLKSRVAVARKNHANFKGEWVYFFISTAKN